MNESAPRRAVLLGAAAVVPLSACDVGSGDSGRDGPVPTRDADRALVDEAVEVEAALVALLTALTRTGPGPQRRRARATLRVHEEHLALLGGDSRRATRTPPRRRDVQGVGASVASAEDRAARRHRSAAGRAASGPFARVLAAMAAASAQQAQVWRS